MGTDTSAAIFKNIYVIRAPSVITAARLLTEDTEINTNKHFDPALR